MPVAVIICFMLLFVCSHDVVTDLFKTSSTFILSANIVHLISGFWKKHRFARVSSLCSARDSCFRYSNMVSA